MNSIDLLISQHHFVDELFDRYARSSEDDKVLVLGKIVEALLIHALLEERYFYPVARRHDMEDAIAASLDDHKHVTRLIGQIYRLEPGAPALDGLVGQLQTAVQRHVGSEENAVFPIVRERVELHTLDTIGKGMESAMADLRLMDLHHLLLESGALEVEAPVYL